jgi:hypothetical protein
MRFLRNLARSAMALAVGWVCGAVILAAGQAATGGIRYAGIPLYAEALFCLRAWIVVGPLLALVDPERAAFRTVPRAAAAGALEGFLLQALLLFPSIGMPASLLMNFWVLVYCLVAAVIGGVAFAVYYRVPLS